MKNRDGWQARAGVVLLLAGFGLTRTTAYREQRVVMSASACPMQMDIVELAGGATQGSVVLFHGLSANKKVMSYIARGFAEQGLRVFVTDFPGHGRSPGPFTAVHAEECAESLMRGLMARGIIDPRRTVLAGHSMGGAIAIRVAARVHVAGVIAISPAPMQSAHGVSPEMLLFKDAAPLPPYALVISGGLEPESMRANAAELLASRNDGSARYEVIPIATHVSLLYSPSAVRVAQEWTARTLQLPDDAHSPSLRGLLGCVLGLAGLLILAGPFLRELVGKNETRVSPSSGDEIGSARLFLEISGVAILTVVVLRYWVPLHFLHLFEGDYLASFLLIAGILLLLLRYKSLRPALTVKPGVLAAAAFGGMAMHLLVTGWLDLTGTEAWLLAARWRCFPVVLLAAFVFCLGIELMLESYPGRSTWSRRLLGLLLLLAVWLVLIAGIYYLHSGEILLVLLAPYFALFFFFQRMGADLVHRETRSPAVAALFSAILLAGFCLVLFPVS